MQDNLATTNLEDLGLELQENDNCITLKRSKKGKHIDLLALVLGILSFPILILAVAYLFLKINNNDLHIGNIFSDIVLFSLGGYLFSLFVTGWNRRQMFGGFLLEKNHSDFKVKQRIIYKPTENTFPLDSQLFVTFNNKDASFGITENNISTVLFELKSLNADQQNRLENIVIKFNS